jgi:hypothetical protein
MYISLTPRWAIFLMGMVAGILGIVPFIAYWKGPEIRARSKYSKILMEEERRRVADAEREDEERAHEEAQEEEEWNGGRMRGSGEKTLRDSGHGTAEMGEKGRTTRYG